jgi:hypothetical protein
MSSVKARMGVVVVACCAARIAASPATIPQDRGYAATLMQAMADFKAR